MKSTPNKRLSGKACRSTMLCILSNFSYYTTWAFVALSMYTAVRMDTFTDPIRPWNLRLANRNYYDVIGFRVQEPQLQQIFSPIVLAGYKLCNIAAVFAIYIHVSSTPHKPRGQFAGFIFRNLAERNQPTVVPSVYRHFCGFSKRLHGELHSFCHRDSPARAKHLCFTRILRVRLHFAVYFQRTFVRCTHL